MELATSDGGCVATWPEASPCSGHGECVHINGTAPYCICDAGWNGNGDWATRGDDCQINEVANAIVWSFVTLLIFMQCIGGIRRLLVWHNHRQSIPAGHALYAVYGSYWTMITKDQPFFITLIHTIHGLLSIPISALHIPADGPRMASSWGLTILIAVSYWFVAVLQYCHGMMSFTLYIKMASRHISVQDNFIIRYKIILICCNILMITTFTLQLLACAYPEWQDIMQRVNIACGSASSWAAGLTRAYYQYRIIQRLRAPEMIKTLNPTQQAERHKAAQTLIAYAKPLLVSAFGPSTIMVILGCSYWARARVQYWSVLSCSALALLGLKSYKTYHPMRAPVITPAVTTTAVATKNAENGKSIAAIGGASHQKPPAPLQWASSRYIVSDHQPTTPGHGPHSTNGANNNNNNGNNNGIVLESVSRAPAVAAVAPVLSGVNRRSSNGGATNLSSPHKSPHNGLLSPTMTYAPSPSPSPQQHVTTIATPVIVVHHSS